MHTAGAYDASTCLPTVPAHSQATEHRPATKGVHDSAKVCKAADLFLD